MPVCYSLLQADTVIRKSSDYSVRVCITLQTVLFTSGKVGRQV